jgi:hypothetical protein
MRLRTAFGAVKLAVWRGKNPTDRSWGIPIRQRWGLTPHHQLSPALEDKLACFATVTGTYEAAAKLAAKVGCPVEDSTIQVLVQRLGAKAEAQTQVRLEETPLEKSPTRASTALAVLMVDGFQVRFRGLGWGRRKTAEARVEWHEAKLGVFYRHEQAVRGQRGQLLEKVVVSWQGEGLELGRRLHWEAVPGVPFLRGIEVQVLDHGYATQYEKQHGKKADWFTTHGDVFPIHGATMKPFGRHNGDRSFPSEERSKGFPEWNHYRIVCTNGVIRLHMNGKEVSGGENCNYRKGYLALESEGAPVEFRNLRIKELPPSGAAAEVTAPVDVGFRPIFTGVDLRGWKTNAAIASRWRVSGERLSLKEGEANPKATLWTEKDYGDAEFVLDCRPSKPAEG